MRGDVGRRPEATNDLVAWVAGEPDSEILGHIPDGSGGFYLVVAVPCPPLDSTPVFVRLKYEASEG